MDDRKTLSERLARAELNIEKGRAHVERQTRLVAELEAVGRPSPGDSQLLKHLQGSLEFFEPLSGAHPGTGWLMSEAEPYWPLPQRFPPFSYMAPRTAVRRWRTQSCRMHRR